VWQYQWTKYHAKESIKNKIHEFTYKNTMNVEYQIFNYTCNNLSQGNSDKRFIEKSASQTRKTFNTFTTKDSYTCNITCNMEITAV
jgi:hypothetical protein